MQRNTNSDNLVLVPPLLFRRNFLPGIYHPSYHWHHTGFYYVRRRPRFGPNPCLCLDGIYNARASFWLYHKIYSPLDNAFHGSSILAHAGFTSLEHTGTLELNSKLIGALMFFTIFFDWSGYLLPWDSLAFGAATIGINMAMATHSLVNGSRTMFGGTALTGQTVVRMYFLHVFVFL